MFRVRRLIAKSWRLSRLFCWLRGIPLKGHPQDEIWYFAYGANMHDSVFQGRREMRPLEWRAGRFLGYRLRFNLEGRPVGKAAPANLSPDPDADVWGVLYRITLHQLVQLDATEGMRYRHVLADAEDKEGRPMRAVSYIAAGKETDGNPSLRYLTLIREGARAHGLPRHWIAFLEKIEHAH